MKELLQSWYNIEDTVLAAVFWSGLTAMALIALGILVFGIATLPGAIAAAAFSAV